MHHHQANDIPSSFPQAGGAKNDRSLGFWLLNPATQELWWSPEMYEIFGVPHDQDADPLVLTRTMIPQSHRRRTELAVQQAISQAGEFSVKHPIIRLDGSFVQVTTQGSVVLQAGAQPDACLVAGAVERVSEDTALSSQPIDYHELFRTLFANSADAIWLVDSSGQILDANERAALDLGLTRDALIGTKVSDIDLDWHPDRVEAAVQQQLADGEPITVEGRHRRKDGSIFPVEVRSQIIQFRNELHFIASIRDMTHRVEVAEELRRKEAELQKAQRLESLGLLAAGLAHDINNLMTPILMQLDLLAAGLISTEEAEGSVRDATLRACVLTRQLLMFSRREMIQLQQHNLREVIEELQPTIRRLVRANIEISYDICDAPVKVDEHRVAQALLNLAANAQDAIAHEGNISVRVEDNVSILMERPLAGGTLTPGLYVVLWFEDDGCGMDADSLRHAFEPFFTTKQSGQGTGLGLPTVHGVVTQHNGGIDIYSKPGEGTKFAIYFPRDSSPESQRIVVEPSAPTFSPQRDSSARILLVEADPLVRNAVHSVLDAKQYTVFSTANGQEAIDRSVELDSIDLLITDVVMPGLGGFELYARLSQKWSDLKVVFMSGYAPRFASQMAPTPSGLPLVQKPLSSDKLLTAIQRVLDGDEGN